MLVEEEIEDPPSIFTFFGVGDDGLGGTTQVKDFGPKIVLIFIVPFLENCEAVP